MDEREHTEHTDDRDEWLAEQFESNRPHLRAVAYRLLGSQSEADDAVQESWLRLSRSDTSGVTNLPGWLTTVVARICLDMLRSRESRREVAMDEHLPQPPKQHESAADPEQDALLADSVGLALLVVLDTLNPAERLAFVLHDVFDVPFDEIAPIVGRTPTAARQLASRARRRVRGQQQDDGEAIEPPAADLARQRVVVEAFLAAARGGDFAALLAVLAPDVSYRSDYQGSPPSEPSELHGAEAVSRQFVGRARGAQLALIGGAVGLAWAPGGETRVAFRFTLAGDRIAAIDLITDPARLVQLAITLLDDSTL